MVFRERDSLFSLAGDHRQLSAAAANFIVVATFGGRRARKWHWTIDRNPLVPDLDSSLPKSKQFFTNLQKSDSKNNFFSCFWFWCCWFPTSRELFVGFYCGWGLFLFLPESRVDFQCDKRLWFESGLYEGLSPGLERKSRGLLS